MSLHDFDIARSRCDRVLGLRAAQVVFDLPAGEVSGALGTALYRIRS